MRVYGMVSHQRTIDDNGSDSASAAHVACSQPDAALTTRTRLAEMRQQVIGDDGRREKRKSSQ
jgi:hypothetical protein